MDLTPLLYDQLHPTYVAVWWDELSTDQKFQFSSGLYDQLHEAANKYCEKIDPGELYYQLSHKYRKSVKELGYYIKWEMDLYYNEENYDDFIENKNRIIGDLAQTNVDWFQDIFQLVPELKPDELKTMLICYFEGLPVWRD